MKKDRIKKGIDRGKQLMLLGLAGLRKEGLGRTCRKVFRVFGLGKSVSFRKWAKKPLYTEEELQLQRQRVFNRKVTFSILVPLYNTPELFLREMIDSVQAQTYPNWELCLADGSDREHAYVERICEEYMRDDHRIKYRKLERNLGIVGNSNACIEMAQGDYLSLLDHDDVLHPAALHDVMEAIEEENADFIYTDEVTFMEDDLQDIVVAHLKKDYAPDDLRANNYICHFTSFQRSLIDGCGAFREGFDGSQDHELFLRLTSAAKKVSHIPKPLYYWRAHGDSTALQAENKNYAGEAGKKAVKSFLESSGMKVRVENAKGLPSFYRVSYEIPSPPPLVSIIIPSCDHVEDLKACVTSILEKTTYTNYEIIIVENNSRDEATFHYYTEISEQHSNIGIAIWPGQGFNWAALNNFGIRGHSSGEYILLLNNDTEVITPDWIQELLMHAGRPEVGAVGAMLYYPNDTVQHAGVIMGLKGVASYLFSRARRGDPGYMGRLCFAQDLSAVTGACLMVRRDVFDEMEGFDESFAVGYNDIDFCLRLREAGYLVVWTPYAELYHYESKSRGILDLFHNESRAEQEESQMRTRWAEILENGDPYYNPNLSLEDSDCRPAKR